LRATVVCGGISATTKPRSRMTAANCAVICEMAITEPRVTSAANFAASTVMSIATATNSTGIVAKVRNHRGRGLRNYPMSTLCPLCELFHAVLVFS
jgi:hypothetical protein